MNMGLLAFLFGDFQGGFGWVIPCFVGLEWRFEVVSRCLLVSFAMVS